VSGVSLRLTFAGLALVSAVWSAQAEDLVMPFACNAAGGEVQVTPSNETSYRIVGRRDEQPFVACAGSGNACETMMIHRFAIACDGQKVPWSRIANAAKTFGAAIPSGLPNGFAPVSTVSGRFVLPALAHIEPSSTKVATQDLSPDSVIDEHDGAATVENAAWVTEVRADVTALPKGNALRVAGVLVAVLIALVAASLAATGRWRMAWPYFESGQDWSKPPIIERAAAFWGRTDEWISMARERWLDKLHDVPGVELVNALSIAQVRYAHVELSVASLAADMLLRDVLKSELQQIRERMAEVERQLSRRAPDKSAAIIRNLLRDLDRIGRISQSAGDGASGESASASGIPQSIAEAYRVLGMNSEAAPAVAKKLVDALRLSWHPDHARDELDRRRREDRMKQINAAWDLIKDRRAAA
jgi:hypothetical protein